MLRNFSLLFVSLAVCLPAQAQENVAVPSDPKAKYTLLEAKERGDSLVEILTRRVGPSGISYSKRLTNCGNATFKYIAEGNTLDTMKPKTYSNPMGPLTFGSISMYVSAYACEKVAQPLPIDPTITKADEAMEQLMKAIGTAR